VQAVAAKPGLSLADDPVVSAVAGCLGNPLAAALISRFPGTSQYGEAPLPKGITEYGMAVTGSAQAVPTETLCVATDSAASATTLAAVIKKAFTAGVIENNNQTWSDRLKNPEVTVVGGPAHLVRLTAQPNPIPVAGVLFGSNIETLLVARH